MAIEKFATTKIPQNWVEGIEKSNLVVNASYANKVVDVMFTGVSLALNSLKKKDKPTAFVFDELNGNFIMGAVVEYHAGKAKDDPGNWSYVWTFNKTDIPDTATVYKASDPISHAFFQGAAMDKYTFTLDNMWIATMFIDMAKTISKWLDDNASENDIVGVELDGVFQARAAVEGGSVVKSIEVIGDTKVLIKDDAAIEK